jgi:membrane protease YdiL (CAAX protease family)
MQNTENSKAIPLSKTLAVLIGFPIIATLISLLLLNRPLITNLGLDFFNTFWLIITIWYLIQIYIVSKILHSVGWKFADIGFSFTKKSTLYFIGGYLLFTFALLVFIELALANSIVDVEKMNKISSLTPKTTTARIIFIIMGLTAGLAEEIVYRGFAIKALVSNKINKWLAVFAASIPFIFQHGLKSIDQFWWFLTWGIVFGILFLWLKKLTLNIIIHWLVILSAMIAILQVIQ